MAKIVSQMTLRKRSLLKKPIKIRSSAMFSMIERKKNVCLEEEYMRIYKEKESPKSILLTRLKIRAKHYPTFAPYFQECMRELNTNDYQSPTYHMIYREVEEWTFRPGVSLSL